MKILKNNLKSELNIRTEKNYPTKGIEFIDITPLIMQKETLKEILEKFANEIKDQKVDYIVAPEARGFLLGAAVANLLEVGCVPIRKKGKLPPTVVESTFDYVKEYGKDQLELPKLVSTTYEGKRFYIIDDIYATGNTMKAIQKEIEQLGGKIIGKGVIMNIIGLNQDKDIFSLIDGRFGTGTTYPSMGKLGTNLRHSFNKKSKKRRNICGYIGVYHQQL